MSSGNLVEVTLLEETVYGETPVAGDFKTSRYVSESLSGTSDTSESQSIRTDRLSSGQVVAGLTVGGDLSLEIAKEPIIDDLFKAAMQSEWVISAVITEDMDLDATAKTLTRGSGDFSAQVRVGDTVMLQGFGTTANNVEVSIAEVVDALNVKFVGPKTLVTESGTGTSFQVADYLEIGIDKKSFSMQKRFLDLSNKAINYRGMVVSDIELNVAYGDIVKGSVSMSGNDYVPVSASADFMTDGRTITDAATTQSLNGSVDMPFIGESSLGILDEASFCIQSLKLKLGNNLSTQNCIGKAAPDDYSLGTAKVEISLSAYLADSNWSMISKKLTQDPFAISFQIKNADGWYSFYLPAIQVSFDDPSSSGQNQDVTLDMDGMGKVGANGESSLRIYRS